MGAVLDADARRINVADDRAVLLDVDAAAGVHIADDFAVSDDVPRMNFGSKLGRRTDGQFMALERDGAIDDAVDLQVFRAGDLTLDLDACADARATTGRSAAEAS